MDEQKIIKIEFTEMLDLNMNEENTNIFKRQLVKKISEILNDTDIEDFSVFKNPDVQEILIKIDNKKSDQ